ncbi:hypothetical protein LOTGIDRAFT_230237 [Lottia gigantea]|uniref:Homeobox domain-containing protein n=1 Tax=Lottia gigantea TaxID=225164 RepID=V4BDV5_LOTGI|nr:hypothetical protein LOTGIDRAFT_230237 [Lottia gigantea]ESP03942.1 hypothetical protein LOTGIDRAFT_230237 [Lottia gigantea]
MKYTDYSIEAILGFNSKQEISRKTEIKEEINDDEIMKYYNREKYPSLDQLEHISLHLHIKTSTLKAWYRNQRQQDRKSPPRNQKCSVPKAPSQDQGLSPLQPSPITPSQEQTKTHSHPRTTTPPHPRETTQQSTTSPHVTSTSQLSLNDGSYHPYFQLISEKIGISTPQTDGNVKTSPRISPSQHDHRTDQSSPILPNQRFQNQAFPAIPTIPHVLPLHLPFHHYYGPCPVSISSSLDNMQPLDLSKPASRSSPENQRIKQSNSPVHPDRVKTHSPNNRELPGSPNLPDSTHKTSPEHQARTKTSPETVNQANTKIRTKSTKPPKVRSTPSPKLSFVLSPPEKQSHFGSGLRQLVIEGRSFSP